MRTLLLACLAVSLHAQQPASAPSGPAPPPPGKNLKVLKLFGLSNVMQSYTLALGVQCEFCHVRGDFASDDNKRKEVARNMIVMTRDLNLKLGNRDDKIRVTCYTCHRGAEHAAVAPAQAPK